MRWRLTVGTGEHSTLQLFRSSLSSAFTPGSSPVSSSTASTLCMAEFSAFIAVLENVSQSPGLPCWIDPRVLVAQTQTPHFFSWILCDSFGPHPLQGLSLSRYTTVPFGTQLPVFHQGRFLASFKQSYVKFNRSPKEEYGRLSQVNCGPLHWILTGFIQRWHSITRGLELGRP